MFQPNQTVVITQKSGQTDMYGQPKGSTRVKEKCAIVKLEIRNVSTTVRSDSSASRGHGKELVADALLLFTKTTAVQIDDKIEIAGGAFRVIAKHPRFNVAGVLDHYEVSGQIWS